MVYQYKYVNCKHCKFVTYVGELQDIAFCRCIEKRVTTRQRRHCMYFEPNKEETTNGQGSNAHPQDGGQSGQH